MSTTDVREWARSKGKTIGSHGRIPQEIQDEYDAEHQPEPGYDSQVTVADFPPDPGPEPARATPEASGETRPRPPKTGKAGARGLFARRGTGKKTPAGRKPARVSLAGLVEDLWGQMAWAAAPMPPMQKLLQVQAPYAGIALDEACKDTIADRMLQPVARAEEKAKAVGGLVFPPMALMLVLATAPEPVKGEDGNLYAGEPSTQHKSALMGFRWSLILMADAYVSRWDEIIARGEATAERARQADKMMAYILGWEQPGEEDEPDGEDEAVSAEEQAITRARAIFGKDQAP